MEQHEGKISSISKPAVVVEASQPVRTLVSLFQDKPDLSVVPVTGSEGFVGCISRKSFQNLMSRPFAQDLYAKEPIHTLFETLPGVDFTISPDAAISEAAIALLALDPALQTQAFPLIDGGRCVAVVEVSDLMLAVTGEQKRLLAELDRLTSRIREEVARATKIQQDLLPLLDSSINGVRVAGGISTSSEIGGDFFDYFAIGSDKVGLVIGDVSGHGVQAGMVTTAAKASLHTLLSLGVSTPAALLSGMNNAILQTARQSLLMTCLIACIDTGSESVTIANAGHNFPYLLRAGGGEPELLDAAVGFPLGLATDSAYEEHRAPFLRHDGLFLYTDGLVECARGDGEELGYERLVVQLKEAVGLHAPDLLHATLLAAAGRFTGSQLFEDDITTLFAVWE